MKRQVPLGPSHPSALFLSCLGLVLEPFQCSSCNLSFSRRPGLTHSPHPSNSVYRTYKVLALSSNYIHKTAKHSQPITRGKFDSRCPSLASENPLRPFLLTLTLSIWLSGTLCSRQIFLVRSDGHNFHILRVHIRPVFQSFVTAFSFK